MGKYYMKIIIVLIFLFIISWFVWDTMNLKRKTFFVHPDGSESWAWANDFLDKWTGVNWCGLYKYRKQLARNVGVLTRRTYEWRPFPPYPEIWGKAKEKHPIFLDDPDDKTEWFGNTPTYTERPKLYFDYYEIKPEDNSN